MSSRRARCWSVSHAKYKRVPPRAPPTRYMNSMSDLRALDDELLAALDALETLTAQPAFDLTLLSNARYRISRAIMARRKCIDALLRKATAQGGEKAKIARVEHDRSMIVRTRYTAHVGTWTPAAVASDWPGYCAASADLRAVIRAKLAEQKPILYPWLALAP